MNIEDCLSYNPDTGIITWKVSIGAAKENKEAGTIYNRVYKVLQLQGKKYLCHRIAWYLHYGVVPKSQIDHINGIRTDNRISNLREVSQRQNSSNRVSHRSGRLVGAVFREDMDKWQSQTQVKGKRIYLGCYDTEIEAHNAYIDKLKELGEL